MLQAANCGVLVIDIQGRLAELVVNSHQVIQRTATLIKVAQLLDLPVITVQQTPEKLGETVPEIANLLYAPIFAKHTFSALGDEEILHAIKSSGITQWLVCGIETHICVYQTVSDLLKLGKKVQLVSDVCSSRESANRDLALEKMLRAGAELTSVEMAIYELIGDSHAPVFRQILPLVKAL
ncbi:isochorismatase family protein [Bowmanella sp. JS7-9]|uniref:Isochorismatase family protein n=1 Tax=Pseudobowmanella zhangzhouensis TaxID=1537679 RepID=A0ABW1XNJ8_9ALTE|nr:isochorismatase family protein [Bowmanella sp. JS7-9]TBX23879.1 isochorismatase [Bowmanella sp. JS7-9]